MVLEVHDDIDGDLGVFFDAIEIDVDRLVGDRVELDGARDHRLLLALVVELNHVREELAGAERHFDVLGLDLDRDRAALAAVEHARDQVRITGRTGAAGAYAFALFNVQNNAGHGLGPFRFRAAGKMEAGLLAEGRAYCKAGPEPGSGSAGWVVGGLAPSRPSASAMACSKAPSRAGTQQALRKWS